MKKPPDENAIRKLLRCDRNRAKGIEWLADVYGGQICGWIKGRFPGLSPCDLEDIWHETLIALCRMSFNEEGSLASLVSGIAWKKAVSCIRRQQVANSICLNSAASNRELNRLSNDNSLDAWERKEIVNAISQAINELPETYRLVWSIFVSGFPKTKSRRVLTELVQNIAPEMSAIAIKNAKQRGKVIIREHLRHLMVDSVHEQSTYEQSTLRIRY